MSCALAFLLDIFQTLDAPPCESGPPFVIPYKGEFMLLITNITIIYGDNRTY